MKKLLIIVGKSGTGKTTLACSLAQWFCDGLDASTFVCTPSFDALGMLTRSGKTMEQGAIIMDDAPFISQADVPLRELDLISIFNVQQACSFPARYHVGQCPAEVARIYTINAKCVNGLWDFGHHLESFPGVAALARGDLQYFLNNPDDQQVALARRCVVLCISDHATLNVPVLELEATLDEKANARTAAALANRWVGVFQMQSLYPTLSGSAELIDSSATLSVPCPILGEGCWSGSGFWGVPPKIVLVWFSEQRWYWSEMMAWKLRPTPGTPG